MGFLTGKYRAVDDAADSPRLRWVKANLTPDGFAALDVLDEIAAAHEAAVAAVALAWLAAQPGVVAPLASARTGGQLPALVEMTTVDLTEEELGRLSALPAR
jgi:aryl-alcohol dehydrogenase-like predicted oxidoreductase